MTRQVTPEEIPALKIGAIIAYIIVLFISIWFLESTVCGIRETKDKIPALLGIFAVAGIVPWVYTRVIIGQLMERKRRASRERKGQYQTVVTLVENLETIVEKLETFLSQTADNYEFEGLLQELRRQVHNLATSPERAKARHQAVKCIQNKWFQENWLQHYLFNTPTKIVREAAKEGLDNSKLFKDFPRKKQQEVRDKFHKDIKQCIKWLIISLQLGRYQNTDGLKRHFKIESSVRPFQVHIVALTYIRNKKVPEYFKNDLEREEVRTYIDFLIDSL
ncbi:MULTISPECIES: hypothetical protein [unclassified Moorena]|uniref:hypothetical protein n=1 Tax=unclassified Moorena TaxID=2683338 RepID=UPI0013FF90B1|nr:MULTISPECIES: hypothetical protein [unclassified Moorena]NEO16679.1 hypothetical protein [Moorena sp. SIO3E8]NEP98640.1 hypothetical protein [Moorena sp. SIO3F7]